MPIAQGTLPKQTTPLAVVVGGLILGDWDKHIEVEDGSRQRMERHQSGLMCGELERAIRRGGLGGKVR
jgi:hypothetical protein